jgi:hypothetical protein
VNGIGGEGDEMAHSTQFGESIRPQYLEHDPRPEGKIPGCGLANLLSQSLMLYLEAEKAHWHLRLNPAAQPVQTESGGSVEIAREVCAISLRLISGISRLQRVLHPNLGPECSALLTAIGEKIAENRELTTERLHDFPEHIPSLVLQGSRRLPSYSAGRSHR